MGVDSAKAAAALGARAAAEEATKAAALLDSDAALEVARGQTVKCVFCMCDRAVSNDASRHC